MKRKNINNSNTIKKLILALIILVIIQLSGFTLIGKYTLVPKLISDVEVYYYLEQQDSLVLNIKDDLNSELIEESLTQRFQKLTNYSAIVNKEDWIKYRTDSNFYSIAIEYNLNNNFTASANYFSGTLYYGEEWESKYFWLFLGWIQIEMKNVGQS